MVPRDLELDIERLRVASKLTGAGSVQAIDEAVSRVVAHGNPKSISSLLLLLADGAEYDEAMFSLIHAAEAFDDQTYIRELLVVLPELRHSAPKWGSIVLMRVLNSPSTKDELTRALRAASTSAKESAKWLCEKINEKSPTFLDKTLPVLLAAKT